MNDLETIPQHKNGPKTVFDILYFIIIFGCILKETYAFSTEYKKIVGQYLTVTIKEMSMMNSPAASLTDYW